MGTNRRTIGPLAGNTGARVPARQEVGPWPGPVKLGRLSKPAGGSVGSNRLGIPKTICAGHNGGAGPRRSTPRAATFAYVPAALDVHSSNVISESPGIPE